MFSHAYEVATKFTFPLIVSLRFFDGTTDCLLGAGMRVNEDGWILSAAHLFEPLFAYESHRQEIYEYQKSVQKIDERKDLSPREKDKIKQLLSKNDKWVTNYAYWWGENGIISEGLHILPEADLALVRLNGCRDIGSTRYPRFKNHHFLKNGTSLCKLGFPFHHPTVSFDESSATFTLQEGTLPVPFFPLEGIYTRWISQGRSADGRYAIKYIETSSPGLRGQSGGPIFDTRGRVWGIQIRTVSIPLGYSPTLLVEGKETVENQFINIGLGVHPEVVIAFMHDNGVRFSLAEDE